MKSKLPKHRITIVPRQLINSYELNLQRKLESIWKSVKADAIKRLKAEYKEAYIPMNVNSAGKPYRNDIFTALYAAKKQSAIATTNYISRQMQRNVSGTFFNEKIIPTIQERSFLITDKNILPGMENRLKDALIQGMKQGATLAQLTDKLDMLQGNFTTIARTETHSAAAEAGFDVATNELNIIGGLNLFKKGWQTADDEKVRDSHQDAGQDYGDGNEIDMDDEFELADDSVMFPGEYGKAPEEVINCRCNYYITH